MGKRKLSSLDQLERDSPLRVPVTLADPEKATTVAFLAHKFDTKVVYRGELPQVLVQPEALQDMGILVAQLQEDEVGWMMGVRRLPHLRFLVTEIYLLDQEVSPVTTELEADAMAALAEDLLARDAQDGGSRYAELRGWGHCHPGESTAPSSTDDEQTEKHVERVGDYYLRLIVNRQGRMEWTLFLPQSGLEIRDVPWRPYFEESPERVEYWRTRLQEACSRLQWQTRNFPPAYPSTNDLPSDKPPFRGFPPPPRPLYFPSPFTPPSVSPKSKPSSTGTLDQDPLERFRDTANDLLLSIEDPVDYANAQSLIEHVYTGAISSSTCLEVLETLAEKEIFP